GQAQGRQARYAQGPRSRPRGPGRHPEVQPMIALELDGGGQAELVRLAGERVSLVSDRAFAPGSRPAFRLADGSLLRVKVHRSVRSGERYAVEGRAFDLTRQLRER